LKERELDEETINQAIDKERGHQSEQDAATQLAVIKLSKTNEQDEITIRRKVISALSRRGFSTDVGSEAFRRAQSENA
jgi:SOS response regulatory protein OraA/RecX